MPCLAQEELNWEGMWGKQLKSEMGTASAVRVREER